MKYLFRTLTILSLLTLVGCGSSTSSDPFQQYFDSIADGLECKTNPTPSLWCIPATEWSKSSIALTDIPEQSTVLLGLKFDVPRPLGYRYYNENDRARARSLKLAAYEYPSTLILQRHANQTAAIMNTIDPEDPDEMNALADLFLEMKQTNILFPQTTSTIKLPKSLANYFDQLKNNPSLLPKPAHVEEGSLVWDLDREESEQRLRKINDHLWIAIAQEGSDHISFYLFTNRYTK